MLKHRFQAVTVDQRAHSRKTWIYFLKTKDEVFDRFREFKALVENATGKKIKVLRSDNGGEYIDKDFTDFCAKEGIKREWTTPYNPQQNGVAERKNRTIVGAAKAMLYDQDLPRFLWAEAWDLWFPGLLSCSL
jgi:transposase InsO family protein